MDHAGETHARNVPRAGVDAVEIPASLAGFRIVPVEEPAAVLSRRLAVPVKTARRSVSSARWLRRQLNDPYVAEAKLRGYRSRAAFKLREIDDKAGLLAPGGARRRSRRRARRLDASRPRASRPKRPGDCPRPAGDGAVGRRPPSLRGDFLEPEGARSGAASPGPPGRSGVVRHGRAGHRPHRDRSPAHQALAEAALAFADEVLAPGGCFVAKVLQGGSERSLWRS